MPSLSDAQEQFRAAVVARDVHVPSMLRAPGPVVERLEIYRRHYREALTRHIVGRYPTVEWLLGSARTMQLAEQFIRVSPPSAPCMAEYGAGFIEALKSDAGTGTLPYLGDVAELDWNLGNVSVAIDRPALAISALSESPPDRLPDIGLCLQPGLSYLRSGWPVDDLVRIRLSEQPPQTLQFTPIAVALEVRGARGQFRIARVDPAVLGFRAALAAGETLGTATDQGLSVDPHFNLSLALASVFAEGLVVEIVSPTEE